MDSDSRYEILDTIATGEFATVSRARDRDLGREVAVKQIHAQYLSDPRQLARYWQEAQLLASLQHPNILTIYDVVRPRGWLILELMRSSLKPAAEGEPMDLDQLRAVLMNCLGGLSFLHSNSVIHGDIKPSNILVGTQNRVKIGDFGLARRASNEEGSLLKGTTKYMAPELLSSQFGAVGPASDLYSLGFTAYELMVGKHFESLLPTLATFGRDKQLAWMMWHSTADVKLPEIQRVLEGVPDNLAHVVQRLIAKDQSQRYASAEEALADLQSGGPLVQPAAGGPEAEAQAALAALKKKRIRNLSVICGGMVFVLGLLIMMMILNRPPKHTQAAKITTTRGTITNVYPISKELGVAPAEGGAARRFIINDRRDVILINGKPHLMDDLDKDDEVEITETVDPATRLDVKEIHATRHGTIATGKLLARDDVQRTIAIETDEDPPQRLTFFVPADLKAISLNALATFNGAPVALSTLLPGDRLTVQYDYLANTGNVVSKLKARRQLELQGVVAAKFDGKLLSINAGGQIVKLPFGSQYLISVNGKPEADPTRLNENDRVVITHDDYITKVVAQRTLGAAGIIEQVRFESRSLNVAEDGGKKLDYLAGTDCAITLGGETAAFDVLRAGDRVTIEHGTIDPNSQSAIVATSIAAERPTDPARWAMLIGVQNYDDTKLGKLTTPLADVTAVAEAMTKRYRVPAEQLRVFSDPSGVTLEREAPEFLKRVGADARLVVYYVGHAVKDDQGQVYLAPKDFHGDQPAVTGRPLQWLVDLMEDCPAKEKLLLLDASHEAGGSEQASEPSSAEMIEALKPQPNRALLRTVTAVASCRKGQHGIDPADKPLDLFAAGLADGYGGAADANHNTRVEPTELFTYLQRTMAAAGQGKETPEIFLPDDRPPRLTEAAKTSIRRLAAYADQTKIDSDEVDQEYNNALQAAGTEPEPRLIYGLLLMKRKDREGRDKAVQHFQVLKSEMPDRLLPYVALAWLRMDKRTYGPAVNELTALVNKIPQPRAGAAFSGEAQFLFQWTGRLREHAAGVAEPSRQLSEALAALDAAVAVHGSQAVELYAQGRKATEAVLADFDKRMAESTDDAQNSKLKIDRKQLSNYADFPLGKYARLIVLHLDD